MGSEAIKRERENVENEQTREKSALEMMEEEELQAQQAFLNRIKSKKFTNTMFFKVNGASVKGAKNEQVKVELIPIFAGAYLDLGKANMVGHKSLFSAPWADGVGGELILQPQGVHTFGKFPITQLELRQDMIWASASLKNVRGFAGGNPDNEIKLTGEKIEATEKEVILFSPMLQLADGKEVPFEKDLHIEEMKTNYSNLEELLYPPAQAETAETPTTEPETSAVETSISEETEVSDIPALSTVFNRRFDSFIKTKGGKPLVGYQSVEYQYQSDGSYKITLSVQGDTYELQGNTGEGGAIFSDGSIPIPQSDQIFNTLLSTLGVEGIEISTIEIKDFYFYPNGDIVASLTAPSLGIELGERMGLEISQDGVTVSASGEDLIDDSIKLLEMLHILKGKQNKSAEEESEEDTSFGHDIVNYVAERLGFEKIDLNEERPDGFNFEDPDCIKAIQEKLQEWGVLPKEGEQNEEKSDDDGMNLDMTFPVFIVPIVPGALQIGVNLFAKTQLGYGISAGVQKTQEDDAGIEAKLEGGIKGLAQFGIEGSLEAQLFSLMGAGVKLGAALNLGGEGEDSTVLSGSAAVTLKKIQGKKMPQIDSVSFEGKGNLRLLAQIYTGADLRVLIWKKELFSYTIKEWELGNLEATMRANKAKGKPWEAEAGFSFSVIGNHVLASMGSEENIRKMFEEKKEPLTQGNFDAGKASFEEVIALLQKYADPNQHIIIDGASEQDSGFLTMNEAIHEIQLQVYQQLEEKRDLMEQERKEMEALLQDKNWQKNILAFKKKLAEIEQRIQNIDAVSVTDETVTDEAGKKMASRRILDQFAQDGGDMKEFEGYLYQKAEKQARSLERIIAYERKRLQEITDEIQGKIDAFKAIIAERNINENDKVEGRGLIKEYESLFGGIANKANYVDTDILLQKEKKRLAKLEKGRHNEKHISRISLIESVEAEKRDQPNPEIYQKYLGMGAKAFQGDLKRYANKSLLMQFCQSVLSEKDGYQEKQMALNLLNMDIETLHNMPKESDGSYTLENAKRVKELKDKLAAQKKAMMKSKKYAYMSASKKDFYDAYAYDSAQKGMDTKVQIYEQISKNPTALIDDLIAYEMGRVTATKTTKKEHEDRLRALMQAAQNENPEEQGKAIQNYFFGSRKKTVGELKEKDFKKKGYLEDFKERLENVDPNVLVFLDTPEEAAEEDSVRSLIHSAGIKKDEATGEIDADANRKMLQSFRQKRMEQEQKTKGAQGFTERDEEEMRNYLKYDLQRTTRSEGGLDMYGIWMKMNWNRSYPEALWEFEQYYQGDGYLKFLQQEAHRWVTPQMMLDYEKEKTAQIEKHRERIQSLERGELSESVMGSKRLEKSIKNEEVSISAAELLQLAEQKKEEVTQKHRLRLESLEGSMVNEDGTEMTDPEAIAAEKERRIAAYDGTKFKPQKEEIHKEFSEMYGGIENEPEKAKESVMEFLSERRDYLSATVELGESRKKALMENIQTTADQMEVCKKILDHTQEAIENPESVLGSAAATTSYIEEVLRRMQQNNP